jgi:hypothetical protein
MSWEREIIPGPSPSKPLNAVNVPSVGVELQGQLNELPEPLVWTLNGKKGLPRSLVIHP